MKHDSLVSSPFEFAICSKWFKNSLKPTIIHFFQFAIHKAIIEPCDTGTDAMYTYVIIVHLASIYIVIVDLSLPLRLLAL